MIRPRFTPLLAALLLGCCGPLLAAPKHALTLYDEPPKYPADFKHFDYVNPDAPKGGILRQADFGGFDSLNPFIGKGVSAPSLGLIYDTLAFQSQDEPFTEYGLLAEKIEKAPDNSYVRFYLRPQARFSDGTPVTAEDVVFTFETLVSKGDPMYRNYYADVDKVVAEDKLRVRFDFKHAGNRELPLILGQIAILPKHWWADRDFSKTGMEIPVGSGPYRIAKVDPGRSISYERVKDWWAKDLPVSRGLYNFDTITIDSYRDMSVALEAFKPASTTSTSNIRRRTGPPATSRRHCATGASSRPASTTTTRWGCRASPSISAARCSRTAGYARRSACCSTSNGRTSSCSSAPTSAPTAISRTRRWPPTSCPAKPS